MSNQPQNDKPKIPELLAMSDDDQLALLQVMSALIHPVRKFHPEGRTAILRAMEDSAAGNVDAFSSLIWLGRAGLTEAHVIDDHPGLTRSYSNAIMHLIYERKYSDIVSPWYIDSSTDLSEAWRNFLNTHDSEDQPDEPGTN